MKAESLSKSMITKVLDMGLNIVQEWLAETIEARGREL